MITRETKLISTGEVLDSLKHGQISRAIIGESVPTTAVQECVLDVTKICHLKVCPMHSVYIQKLGWKSSAKTDS